ncbi:molecular chaperone, partial [Escherichia coli]
AISINNETANWITVTTIKAQNVKVNNESILLPPFSHNDITLKNNHASEYELTVVDDYGNNIHSKIAAR